MIFDSLNLINIRQGKSELRTHKHTHKHSLKNSLLWVFIILICINFVAVFNSEFWEVFQRQPYGIYVYFAVTVFSIVMLILLSARSINSSILGYLSILIVIATFCVISAYITKGAYRYLGVSCVVVGTTMIVSNTKITYKMSKTVFCFIIIITVYGLFKVGDYYNMQWDYDSVNSNYVAFFGLAIMVYGNLLLTYIRSKEGIVTQIIRLLFAVSSLYIIIECQSRGALLGWIFYILCVYFVPWRAFCKAKIISIFAFVIVIASVLMTYIYCHIDYFKNAYFLGKKTDHRMKLWSYFWERIGDNPLNNIVGFGTKDALTEIFGYGLHNVYLSIWYYVGLIGFVLFMGFIIWNFIKISKENADITIEQGYAILGFLCFMVQDNFAVTFTSPLVVWNYFLLGLAHFRLPQKESLLVNESAEAFK